MADDVEYRLAKPVPVVGVDFGRGDVELCPDSNARIVGEVLY